ncbi:hypothetical protein PS918_02186 [Pseudomonas fluorescens]|uniref:Uncharacterized protein n=1 Tax=Pseudomonas fluorescens TaxID=294 RepID=A0A5E7S1D5_PSEFL|nr:hypothetical protein PS918_02186 [Pseudomonas fluorescens]
MGGVKKGAGRTIRRLSAITQNRSGRREIENTVDRPSLVTRNQVAINAVFGALELGVGLAKALAVPEVYAGLVADFYIGVQILEQVPGRLDHFVLGFP